ncbi:MAG: o-succinylbenzoate synthase [Promicromonosporaceae bacterium]|nr:o-succinylbenzoate synthase [Promicromonosporaceae bacterium]
MDWVRETLVWQTPLTVPFRGLRTRDGMLLRGSRGWGEFSPFWDYDDDAAARWLAATHEAAVAGWPEPVRGSVPVNVTVPAVDAARARTLVLNGGGCRTAKIKVAQVVDGKLEALTGEIARVAAVREALDELFGTGVGRIRLDANGAWSVPQAVEHLRELNAVAGGLEYVEQPCHTVEELAELRRELRSQRIPVLVAADESIRNAEDPLRVRDAGAADVVVLKVAPLGGVRACLDLADEIGLPVVVSSALESSIGLAAGLALAGALPELPFACGLATSSLLERDVIVEPLRPQHGELPVLRADDARLTPNLTAPESPESDRSELSPRWKSRLNRVAAILA